MNNKKYNYVILFLQCLLFLCVLVFSNDTISNILPFNLVPYLCASMFVISIIGFILNRNSGK